MLGCCRLGPGKMTVKVVCDDYHPQIRGYVSVESMADICHDPYDLRLDVVHP